MRKTVGINAAALIIWGLFIALGAWVFGQIAADSESPESYYRLIGGFAFMLFSSFVVKEWLAARKRAERYRLVEQTFSELTSIADLEVQATYCHVPGMVAIYQNHLFCNWAVDLVDLAGVHQVSYQRTLAVKARTGTVAGNRPVLVFQLADGQEEVVSLPPLAPVKSYLPDLLRAIQAQNPEVTFGSEQVTVEEYVAILTQQD